MFRLCSYVFILSLCFGCEAEPATTDTASYDVVVYGGSSAAVIAAVAAHRLDKTALIISPDRHLGGLSSSGLGATDVGNKIAVTGMSRQFYRELGKHYGVPEAWAFEPHHAEELYERMVAEGGVTVWRDHHLEEVIKDGTAISELVVVDGGNDDAPRRVTGKQFIDATYVGDLLAAAGVSYTLGRESNDTYGETINGVQVMGGHQFPAPSSNEGYLVDPYVVEGDPASGLVYGVSDAELDPEGTGDSLIQAYNYRLCLTQREDIRVPFTAPAGYDSTHYELLGRLMQGREKAKWRHDLTFYLSLIPMPNGKTDVNNKGPFSTDFIGENHDYPEGDRTTRRRIEAAHERYIRGLLYYLQTAAAVPAHIREETASWGWSRDEFTDNNYFPPKLYIREGRRMVSDLVMTEHHCLGDETVTDPIGMAAYTMDSHNCQRIVQQANGKTFVRNEGNVEVGGFPPFQIGYGAIVPKQSECTNLLVPVCLSSSHIAYGSIRMEPVFMVLGQTAALAASLAIDQSIPVQEVDARQLRQRLDDDPRFDGSTSEVLVDNSNTDHYRADAGFQSYTRWMRTYNVDAQVADGLDTDQTAEFTFPVTKAGDYQLYYYVPGPPKGDKQYVAAMSGELKTGGTVHSVNIPLGNRQKEWVDLGSYRFAPGQEARLTVRSGSREDGYVVADAVMLLPKSPM